jgi:hypothetical protein
MANAPTGSLLVTGAGAGTAFHLKVGNNWHPATDPSAAAEVAATLAADTPRIVSLLVVAIDADGEDLSFEGLGFDRSHPTWVGHVMSATPARRADHLQNMFAITIGANVSALELRNALFTGAVTNAAGELERVIALIGGLDGARAGRCQLRAGARRAVRPRRHLDRRRAGFLGLRRGAGDQQPVDLARRIAPRLPHRRARPAARPDARPGP